MPSVLTTASKVQCMPTAPPPPPPPPPPAPPPPPMHGGNVTLGPGSGALRVNGDPVLTSIDIAAMPIPDCKTPVTPAGNKPCTAVGTATGQSKKLLVGGQPVMLSTLAGGTDGVPPGSLAVISVQTKLTSD